jgi:uncharacterized protein (TIGR01777 family)
MGLGGRVGDGKQYMSWIALDDVLAAILYALDNNSVSGPVNLVAPDAVTNSQFTKILGEVISRPTMFPVPAFALRAALGEMADALLLSSIRVVPEKLNAVGYKFLYPELKTALRHLIKG